MNKVKKFIDLNMGGEMTEVSRALHTRQSAISGTSGRCYLFRHKGETSGVVEIYEEASDCSDARKGCD